MGAGPARDPGRGTLPRGDPRRGALRAALATAADADVPVVALTVGSSPTGRAMVTAHSGAVAGTDAAWEALFTSYGVHRARDMEELVDTLELFAIGRRVTRPAAGIATVHDSGAERVLVADVAASEGVPFAPLSEPTAGRLTGLLDDGLVVGNPLDVWGRGADTESLFTDCLRAVADDPGVDVAVLAVDLVEEYDGDESYPRAVRRVAAEAAVPLVVLSAVAAAVDQTQAGELRRAGIPVLEGARSGLRAIEHLRDHARRPPRPADLPPAPTPATDAVPSGWLDATASLGLLAAQGLAVVPTQSAATAADAGAAAERLGYPVVVKTDEPGIAHRAAADGVRLGLTDRSAVDRAYAELAAACGPRVVVQPQLSGTGEVALGIVHDPALGPLVLVAVGGTDIERVARRAIALPPVGPELARRLLERIGQLDPSPGLVSAVEAISRVALELGDRIVALDVNPLVLTEDGPVAVDALIEPRT
ncbi:MAG: acetate--CoA ligase family protein [Nocardioides sp.]